MWICLSPPVVSANCSRPNGTMCLDKGTWFIPAEATKGHKGKRQDHHVFLSPLAMMQFKRLHAETGHTAFCFPAKDERSHINTKTVSKLIGDRQVPLQKSQQAPCWPPP